MAQVVRKTLYQDAEHGLAVTVDQWEATAPKQPSQAERAAAERSAVLAELQQAVAEATDLVAQLPPTALALRSEKAQLTPQPLTTKWVTLELRAAPPAANAPAADLSSLFTLLAGLLDDDHGATIALELVADHESIRFQVSAPMALAPIVQQQFYAAYPTAAIDLAEPTQPTLPNATGVTLSFTPEDGELRLEPATDPLAALLETLGELHANEHTRVQFVLSPREPRRSLLLRAAQFIGTAIHERLVAVATDTQPITEPKPAIARLTIRAVASAPTSQRSAQLLRAATAPFYQWSSPTGASLTRRALPPRALATAFERRTADRRASFLVTAAELASLYHLPPVPVAIPRLVALTSARLSPPIFAAHPDGLELGRIRFRTRRDRVIVAPADRLRHLYLIGQTGTGKSSLFQSLFLQDLARGDGGCFIDPHGEAIDWLLERIPKERLNDVVLFDPSKSDTVLGLNLLEWRTPEERDLLIQELILLFYKLFDPDRAGIIGPQFEHWLRSAALTVTEPAIRGTLGDIPRLFTDERYQRWAVKRTTHPAAKRFWLEQMAQTSAFHRSEMLNYFTSKFGAFLGNATIAQIVSQPRSAFDLRSLMDKRKILLVNLSKGKIGDLNAQLLGTVLITKIQLAALSRANISADQRQPFYVYLDEFHTLATDSFASLLSEIRKYGVGLSLTHQYVNQLSPTLRDAVLGNVGTVLAYRLGHDDAQALASFFHPLTADDLMRVEAFHLHCKTLQSGAMSEPFTVEAFHASTAPVSATRSVVQARMRAASALLRLSSLPSGGRNMMIREAETKAVIESRE